MTFHNLKFLKLVKLRISRWDASEKSFPLLETLVIKWGNYLEEIPLSFAEIQPLKQIKLIGNWKESLKASTVRIKEEVEDIEGCDRVDLKDARFLLVALCGGSSGQVCSSEKAKKIPEGFSCEN